MDGDEPRAFRTCQPVTSNGTAARLVASRSPAAARPPGASVRAGRSAGWAVGSMGPPMEKAKVAVVRAATIV